MTQSKQLGVTCLFALTEKNIEKYDIYQFLAISRGLCDRQYLEYAVRNFA